MRPQVDQNHQRVAAAAGTVCLAGLAHTAMRSRRAAPLPRYAREVMTQPVQTITSEATVAQAAERFAESGVGVLPVCSETDRLVGMLTDRDLVVRVLAQGEDPAHFPVLDCADPDPITATENETLDSLRARMQEGGIRRIPVLRHGRLVGIVGPTDLPHINTRRSRLGHGLTRLKDDHRSARWLFHRSYRPGPLGHSRIDERRRRASDAALVRHIQELRRKQ